jgi:AAA domain
MSDEVEIARTVVHPPPERCSECGINIPMNGVSGLCRGCLGEPFPGGSLVSDTRRSAPSVRIDGDPEPDLDADLRIPMIPLDWQAMLRDGVPPVDYLDPPYFVRAARTWGWGPSGTAKSIFAMWKAAALTRAGHRVVYISEENPLVEDIRRLGRLNPDPDLMIVYHREGVDLARPEWVREVLRVSEGAAMTVFDSWTDCWQGDENDNRAVQQFDSTVLKKLQDLGVAPFVIHHTGHPSMFGARKGVNAGRGASSLGQKADVVLAFSAGMAGEIQTFKLSYPKGRVGGEAPPEQLFRVVDTEDGGLDILPEGSVQEIEDVAAVEDIVQAIMGSDAGELTSGAVRKLAGGRGRQQRVMELLHADPRLEVVEGVRNRRLWRVRPDRLWE